MKRLLAVMLLCGAWGAPAIAGSFQDRIENRWRGAWILTRIDTYADCAGAATHNRVNGSLVDGRGRYRFGAGELAKVERVDLKRSRLDLHVRLREPYLVSWQDGPFTLYREAACQIELEVELPRKVVQNDDLQGVETILQPVVQRFTAENEARASRVFNQRRRAPYPRDYERTLARYEAWKAERTNAAVQARIDQARQETARLADRVSSDPDYLKGFAAGIESMRERDYGNCGALMSVDLTGGEPKQAYASKTTEEQARFDRGKRDGGKLVLGLELLRRLPGCFVRVPQVEEPPAGLDSDSR